MFEHVSTLDGSRTENPHTHYLENALSEMACVVVRRLQAPCGTMKLLQVTEDKVFNAVRRPDDLSNAVGRLCRSLSTVVECGREPAHGPARNGAVETSRRARAAGASAFVKMQGRWCSVAENPLTHLLEKALLKTAGVLVRRRRLRA